MAVREAKVGGVAWDREREHPVILLGAGEDDEVLPIWVGRPEGSSIAAVLAGRSFERPMTHDLMRIIVDVLDAAVDRIEITGIHEDTYFARIVLRRGEEEYYLDARPSDSIALALRAGAPIFVDEELWSACKRPIAIESGADAPETERGPGRFEW
ncbi:MAG: bifunctional nuclease family protein [Candidatus Krumholzibacteriota bacterium]|nr:bifunctional nuclease family protein [Candidatus Krumholzibacteriota bacterium]